MKRLANRRLLWSDHAHTQAVLVDRIQGGRWLEVACQVVSEASVQAALHWDVLLVANECRGKHRLVFFLDRAQNEEGEVAAGFVWGQQALEAYLGVDGLIVEQVLHIHQAVDLLASAAVAKYDAFPEELQLFAGSVRGAVDDLVVCGHRGIGRQAVDVQSAPDDLVLWADYQVWHSCVVG